LGLVAARGTRLAFQLHSSFPSVDQPIRQYVYRSCTHLSLSSRLSDTRLNQIEHLGTVTTILLDAGGCTLTISDAQPILEDCHIGDSIAVNGACLTVTKIDKTENGGWFEVWLANETLQRTDLGIISFTYSNL
jgi:hypothetical protein